LTSAQKNSVLPDTTGACVGDSLYITLGSNIDKKAKITWITPKNIEYNTKKINATGKPGKYIVTIQEANKIIKDSTVVIYSTKPKINIRDTVYCKNSFVLVDARNPQYTYQWSNGENGIKTKIDLSGKYFVTANNKGCLYTDTFRVNTVPGITLSFLPETSFCLSDENKSLSVKAPTGTKIVWNTGSSSSSINATKQGKYWVKTENKICGSRTDTVFVTLKACDCEMLIPNSFTPNEDNKNDYFFPVLQCEYSLYSFTVFDKWGNQIFTTNNPTGKWDGRFKGNLCDEDIYVYKIESTEKESGKKVNRSGRVSLIR
jgi:gliding motility-associated-like protein